MYGNECVSTDLSLRCRLCAQSLDRDPMSAITTSSGSTCPSHQESAWGAAEARQERVNVEVVRKAIVVGKCLSLC